MAQSKSRVVNATAAGPVWRPALTMLPALVLLTASSGTGAAPGQSPFDEPLFRRCIDWMLSGSGGALIDNLCVDHYALPPPSLFLCARKVMTGFKSESDQEGCAILFEEEAKKVRAGYVK
jgi:hypothetical protein